MCRVLNVIEGPQWLADEVAGGGEGVYLQCWLSERSPMAGECLFGQYEFLVAGDSQAILFACMNKDDLGASAHQPLDGIDDLSGWQRRLGFRCLVSHDAVPGVDVIASVRLQLDVSMHSIPQHGHSRSLSASTASRGQSGISANFVARPCSLQSPKRAYNRRVVAASRRCSIRQLSR